MGTVAKVWSVDCVWEPSKICIRISNFGDFMNLIKSFLVFTLAGVSAQASFTEKIGRCIPDNKDAAFSAISIQGDTVHKDRGLMVQVASDGLMDVFAVKFEKKAKGLQIKLSDGRILFADYNSPDAAAIIKYNDAIYSCEREQ